MCSASEKYYPRPVCRDGLVACTTLMASTSHEDGGCSSWSRRKRDVGAGVENVGVGGANHRHVWFKVLAAVLLCPPRRRCRGAPRGRASQKQNGRDGITHGHDNAHVGRMQLRDVVCWRRKRDVRAIESAGARLPCSASTTPVQPMRVLDWTVLGAVKPQRSVLS